jgi:plastocyanin
MSPLAAAALVLTLAACGGGTSEDPTISPAGGAAAGCAVAGTTLSIAANDIRFDTSCLAAPAGQDVVITFTNKESLPHDVAILKPGSSDQLFTGDIITGPKTVSYRVPALAPGSYPFECTVHPGQMKGTLVVR